MADCLHKRISFNHQFAVGPHERMYQLSGHCCDCGAAMVFEPRPSLSIDSLNFQIPFTMGPPDLGRLMPKPAKAEPIIIGGNRRGMN